MPELERIRSNMFSIVRKAGLTMVIAAAKTTITSSR